MHCYCWRLGKGKGMLSRGSSFYETSSEVTQGKVKYETCYHINLNTDPQPAETHLSSSQQLASASTSLSAPFLLVQVQH